MRIDDMSERQLYFAVIAATEPAHAVVKVPALFCQMDCDGQETTGFLFERFVFYVNKGRNGWIVQTNNPNAPGVTGTGEHHALKRIALMRAVAKLFHGDAFELPKELQA